MAPVRVIPPFRCRGLYAATASLAIVLAAAQTGLMQVNAVSQLRASLIAELAVTLGPPFVFVLAFAALSQRRTPVLLSAFLFGFIHLLTLIITGSLAAASDRGSSLLTSTLLAMLAVSCISGVITALFALVIRWLARTFVVTLAEQTGQLCTHCGYTVDPASLPVCPECGLAPDFGRVRLRRLHAAGDMLRRRARPTLVSLLTLLAAATAVTVGTSGLKLDRFRRAVNRDGSSSSASGLIESTGPEGYRQRWVVGAWKPGPNSPGLGVIVAYDPSAGPDDPVMQIRAATRTTIGPAAYSMTNLPVVCTLTRAQAEQVLQHGLPDALLEAMLAAAGSQPGPRAVASEVIDPTPYFPE